MFAKANRFSQCLSRIRRDGHSQESQVSPHGESPRWQKLRPQTFDDGHTTFDNTPVTQETIDADWISR
jgi:hypothetical protein